MKSLSTDIKCFFSSILAIFIPSFELRKNIVANQLLDDRPVWMDDEFELS
jgi:hypothetical protein